MPYSLVWNLKAFFQEIYIFELINAQLLGERNLVTKMVKPKEMEEEEREREKSTLKYLFSIFTKFSDRAENCMRKKDHGARKSSILSPRIHLCLSHWLSGTVHTFGRNFTRIREDLSNKLKRYFLFPWSMKQRHPATIEWSECVLGMKNWSRRFAI